MQERRGDPLNQLNFGGPSTANQSEKIYKVWKLFKISAFKSLTVLKPPDDEKEERPSLKYKDLIIEAIESSPEKKLKLSEIFQVSQLNFF